MRSVLTSTLGILVAGCSTGSIGGSSDGPTGPPTPELVSSSPSEGAVIPRTEWLVLTFAVAPDPASFEGFGLDCGSGAHEVTADPLDETTVVVNPVGTLPPSATCVLSWVGPAGEQRLSFSVAGDGEPVEVVYDRDDASLIVPFPDDFVLDDAETPTGKVVAIPPLERDGAGAPLVVNALAQAIGEADGHSPLAPFVMQLAGPVDPSTIPRTEAESVDPLATILLFETHPDSDTFGQRVPFTSHYRDKTNAQGEPEHVLIIYPGVPLEPRGQYTLVVQRRALADPTRPLQPSSFLTSVFEGARETQGQAKVGAIVDDVLPRLKPLYPPLRADDIALLIRTTIRSMDHVAADMMHVREELDALPLPTFVIDDVAEENDPNSHVAAIVTGTWHAPRWWVGDYVIRDGDGKPFQNTTEPVPFVLALPKTPLNGRAPVVIYQHGNPGTAEGGVPIVASTHLAEAGFAVIGFTSLLSRTYAGELDPVGAQLSSIFTSLITQHRFPETICLITNIEQLGFLKLIEGLEALDVLPLQNGDGVPDLDLDAPLSYFGVSNGAHDAMGLLPFAPEIDAAVLIVGGGRYASSLFHQDGTNVGAGGLYDFVTGVFPDIGRADTYAQLAMVQAAVDNQDWLNRAPLLFRDPLGLGASPSVLMVEGVGDLWTPRQSTRAGAYVFDLPHIGPQYTPSPYLTAVEGPVAANLNDRTATGGLFQFVADGNETPPSSGCEGETDGHFCAQIADGAEIQRVQFLLSVQSGAPEIIVP